MFSVRYLLAVCVTVVAIAADQAAAVPLEELEKYDLNHNNCIDLGREEDLLLKHLANPVLRVFDNAPMDGVLNATEARNISTASPEQLKKLPPALTETQLDEFRSDLEVRRCKLADLADKPKPAATKDKAEQRLFLRKNRLDVSIFNKAVDSSAAEGANLS